MFTRLMGSGMVRFTALVVVLAVVVLTSQAQDRTPRPPMGGRGADLDKARADVCAALEHFRQAEAKLRDAEKRLRELEGKTEPGARDQAVDMKVFRLKHADAVAVAQTLQAVFGKGQLVIVAEPATNSLLVRGTIDELVDIAKLLEQIDIPSDRRPRPEKKDK